MIDFTEKYNDLLVNDGPTKQLKTIPGEQRGDDMGSSILASMDYSDESLFLFSKKYPDDGFLSNYGLREETKNRLKEIRANSIEFEEAFKDRYAPFLPMTYDQLMELELREQIQVINKVKTSKYEKLYLVPTKFSREEKARIRKREAELFKNK